jgi:hypothetical protein
LTGCGSGNDADDINLSEKRIAEMTRLRWEIEQVDIAISNLVRRSAPNAEINQLESGREILLKKVMVLHEIEQEYQSRK